MANSYPVLRKRFAFAAKVEATSGTPETLSWSTNAVRLLGVSTPEEMWLSPNERSDAVTGTLGTAGPESPVGKCYRTRLRFSLPGAGSAYAYTNETTNNLPECHPLLRAAGFSLAVSGGAGSEKATYSLSDDPATTITAYLEVAGKKYILTFGVIEGLTISYPAGSFPVAEGDLIAIASSYAEADLDSATYDSFTTAPYPTIKGASSLVIGSYEPAFQSFSVAYNTQAAPNVNGNATDGHGGYRIVSRNPVASVSGRVTALATWDPQADVAARTSRTIDAKAGSVLYKRAKIDIDAAIPLSAQVTPDGEYMNYSVSYQITPATAEASIVFD